MHIVPSEVCTANDNDFPFAGIGYSSSGASIPIQSHLAPLPFHMFHRSGREGIMNRKLEDAGEDSSYGFPTRKGAAGN